MTVVGKPVKTNQPRADYGIDAPKVVLRFFLFGATGLIGGLALAAIVHSRSVLVRSLIGTGIFGGCSWVLTAAFMVLGSRVFKLRLRERFLDEIPWRGDERVLDVGCGRGLMLIGAAKRLATGVAVGIDLWSVEDQSGNSPATTRANAIAEGVNERIEIETGDARKLPFEANSFDTVVSSWALHNIYETADRERALREIVRVLKPGGRVMIVDIRHAREYAAILQAAGMNDVRVSRPSFVFVIPSHAVFARKGGD